MKYTELSEDEQVQVLRNRLKELEGSLFVLHMKEAENKGMVKLATRQEDVDQLNRESAENAAAVMFHHARIKAVQAMIDAYGNDLKPEPK